MNLTKSISDLFFANYSLLDFDMLKEEGTL